MLVNADKFPLKAIRQNCIDCSGGSPHEVRLCEIPGCALYRFRFGCKPTTYARRVRKQKSRDKLSAAR